MAFQEGFLWGTASAAYQVEGAYNEDGKGMGIWDALSMGHIKHEENGNDSTDHYHRYKEDVSIMKDLGLKAYRFSVSWPRIMPESEKINHKGIEFYQNLVDELIAAGIEPIVTLYHWNLPMWLHEKEGWAWSGILEIFADYTRIVVEALSSRVKYWITFNEPNCVAEMGYVTGWHAPFIQNPLLVFPVTRNIMLAHGAAVRIIREFAKLKPRIGLALNGLVVEPCDTYEKSLNDARWKMFGADTMAPSNIAWWGDPMILGKRPAIMDGKLLDADLEMIHQPLDFFGFNCYFSNGAEYAGMPRTTMDWPITPDALYWMAKFCYERYELPIFVTENGMANVDFVMSDGKVHDSQRIEYIRSYLQGLRKAANEGIPIIGYLYWSYMDNFEWTEGYDKRFGLVYVDYLTKKRTIKDSAYAYAEIIRRNGEI